MANSQKAQLIFFLAIVTITALALLITQEQDISGGAIISVSDDESAARKLISSPTTSVSKVTNDIGMGAGIASNAQPEDYFDNPLKDDDISLLQSAEVQFNNGDGYDDYTTHDELWFAAASPSVQSSLSEASIESDYGTKIALEVAESSIYYYYVFEDAVEVDAATTDYPMEILFMGRSFRITGADTDKITVQTGETFYMKIGDSVAIEGHTVKLEDLADGVVGVSVDGGSVETIEVDDMHAWSEGVQVLVDSIFYKAGAPGTSGANLLIGSTASKSYSDGEEFLGEDESDPYWEWVIDNLDVEAKTSVSAAGTATGPIIAMRNSFSADSSSDSDPAVVTNAGCYSIPTKDPYAQLCIDDLTVSSNDYMKVEVEIEDLNLNEAGGNFANAGTQQVLSIKASKNDGLVINSGALQGTAGYLANDAETDEIYLFLNGTVGGNVVIDVFYMDENQLTIAGNVTSTPAVNEEIGNINYDDTKGNDLPINLQLNPSSNFNLNLTAADAEIAGAVDSIGIQVTNGTTFDGFGRIDHVNDVHDTNIATQDDDLRTDYGVIIKDPENGINGDQIEFEIPSDAARAEVSLKAYEANITNDNKAVTLSTSDSSGVTDGSFIVGGPAVNKVTAEAMGVTFPTYGSELGWEEGYCYIKKHVLNGKSVTVIAGYSKSDTAACVDKYLLGTKNFDGKL